MTVEAATQKLDEVIEGLRETQEQVNQIVELRAQAVERADRAEKEVQRLHRLMAERQMAEGITRTEAERLASTLADEIHHTATAEVEILLRRLVDRSYTEQQKVDAWRELQTHSDWRDLVWRALECAELEESP